ncbi:sodium/hydrogen exchanger family protein, partial [Vibrio parahaemolyticus VPTS-2010_2]
KSGLSLGLVCVARCQSFLRYSL